MRTSRHVLRPVKGALIIAAFAGGVAFGADRIASRSTPRGRPAPSSFKIAGALPRPLRPGLSLPLDLRLTNPHTWGITVRRVSVAIVVDPVHEKLGCNRFVHYRQTNVAPALYPLRLKPRTSRTLRQLGVRVLPTISMLDLPTNQDMCQGATLRLRYAGIATRTGRPSAR